MVQLDTLGLFTCVLLHPALLPERRDLVGMYSCCGVAVGGRWAPRCLPMCLVTLASLSNRWLGMLWPHSRVVGRGLAGFFFLAN